MERDGAGVFKGKSLCFFDVCRLKSFWALYDLELDLLPLFQRLKSLSCDCAEMNENVFSLFAFDEPEALGSVEPFYRSLLHVKTLSESVTKGDL